MATLIIGLGIALLDQAAKVAVRQWLPLGVVRPVVDGFFNLTHVRNTGAVWGIFQSQNGWLVLVSLSILLLIAIFYRRLVDHYGIHRLAMGLMVGGIIGNLMDRILLGWVVDFLDFHWRTYHWPAFNIADAAICLGVIIYLLSSGRRQRELAALAARQAAPER